MNTNEYSILKPDLQFQSAPASDVSINTQLDQTQSEVIDFDRTVLVNLATFFDEERQKSNTFRPTLKISYLYENNLVGTTRYEIFRDNLYYVNPEISVQNNSWSGLPSYQEFEFIRNDVNNPQLPFIIKSAASYNWSIVLSYPIENDFTVPMDYYYPNGTSLPNWVSGDGIPFKITNGTDNGLPIVQFTTPVKHGILPGQYVELSFAYDNINVFQVDSLGNGTQDSEQYIFNINNPGFTGTTFDTNNVGTFKRIINVNNSGETKSKYYVRIHKIITNPTDSIITRAGFEINSYDDEGAYQFSSLTPNQKSFIAKYQSSNAYNVTFARDLEIINQLDNNKKPVSQIFATFQNLGYFGMWNKLRRGWKMNMTPLQTNPWWDSANLLSEENVLTSNYIRNQNGATVCVFPPLCYNFTVNLPRLSGDTMYGDWCEWNDWEQEERVISEYVNKMTYYNKAFSVSSQTPTNASGYYYQVHFPIRLKSFSEYIEEAGMDLVEGVPNYAYFSENLKTWYWKDILPYGVQDSEGNGVDYPFLNETHYPFLNIPFRLYPEGSSFDITEQYSGFVVDPLIDECE